MLIFAADDTNFHSLKHIKTISLLFASLVIGGMFVLSAQAKLYPVEPFEFTFVDLGIANWHTAPFIARFFIGLEFFIGALFVLNISIRTACKIAAVALVLFSIYLFGLLLVSGNKGNCGCLGEYFAMTPVQALIKNAVMLSVIGILYKFYRGLNFGWGKYVVYASGIAAFAFPHVSNYVDLNYSEAYLTQKKEHFKLELDSLYKNAQINIPPPDLSEKKYIIAFMSLTPIFTAL